MDETKSQNQPALVRDEGEREYGQLGAVLGLGKIVVFFVVFETLTG